jgi:hypothetical protein
VTSEVYVWPELLAGLATATSACEPEAHVFFDTHIESVEFLDRLPKMGTDKIDRQRLREPRRR